MTIGGGVAFYGFFWLHHHHLDQGRRKLAFVFLDSMCQGSRIRGRHYIDKRCRNDRFMGISRVSQWDVWVGDGWIGLRDQLLGGVCYEAWVVGS